MLYGAVTFTPQEAPRFARRTTVFIRMISRSDIRTETFSENGGKRLIWQGFSPETGDYELSQNK